MAKVDIVTCLTLEQVRELLEESRLYEVDTTTLTANVFPSISKYMRYTVGYGKSPTLCVSMIDGELASLKADTTSYKKMLNIRTGNFLLHFKYNTDVVCNMALEDYLRHSRDIAKARSQYQLDDLEEDLIDMMYLGKPREGYDVIAFVPFLDVNYLHNFKYLSDSWELEEQRIYQPDQISSMVMNLLR